jgi:hypothetical protein
MISHYNDVLNLQEQAERDAMDGKIDDPALKANYLKELTDMVGSTMCIIQCLTTPQTKD